MGRRKRVKTSTNMKKKEDGNGETSTSLSSMKRTRGQPLTTDKKIGGGGNESKKMKRGESSNSCMRTETASGQTQESSVKETTINNLSPENANGEPSTSSLYRTRSRKRKIDEDDSSNPPGQDEAAGEGPINDLPPEMLTKILKSVDTRSLFKCRLVSRLWCDISSEILTARTDIMPSFKDYDTKWVRMDSGSITMAKYKNNRLQEFVNLMKKCKNCPYASFSFNVDGPSFFDTKDWIEFLSIFAPENSKQKKQNPNQIQNETTKIKCFYLKCGRFGDTKELLLLTERLSDLLLNKIPRLEELSLVFALYKDGFKNVKLFPLPKTPESSTKTVAVSPSVPVQLPYLKVLEIEPDMFVNLPGIIEALLNAAVNLTEIKVKPPGWDNEDCNSQVFQFLYSLGKLHLIKQMEIVVDEDFLSSLGNSTQHSISDFRLAFKFHELTLNTFASIITPDFYADATNFISTLLESSKDTLEKLKMPSLGFLDELQFPEFTKLKTLKLETCDNDGLNDVERGQQLFPRGIRSRSKEIFSTVDDLSLNTKDWQRAFPQEDSIPIFSSVHTLCFSDKELDENAIFKLALMCPNLKHCTIKTDEGNPGHFNFPQVVREIWTHLKQLESLEVDVDVNLENYAFPALDSCFTGISTENCKRLQNFMKAEKTKNKSKSQVKLPESEELKTLTKREHPSILDMKNLKKLTINPHSGKKQHQGKNFFTTKITWISEEFAFKLMPHIEFNGRRPSTTS